MTSSAVAARSGRKSGAFHYFQSQRWLRTLIAWLCAFEMAILPMIGSAYAGGNQIVIDGRTATSLTTKGRTTDVRTGTIHGKNAYNSFRQFNVNSGNTVNLHVPGSADNLINLVHDKRTDIHGTLNTLKNGKIGGNVYLLNPHGVLVGPQGTINTGSISLQTPTTEFMGTVLSPGGTPSADAVSRILQDSTPISPTGLVSVQGQINALDSARIRAGGVDISGRINAGASGYAAMKNAVNLGGLMPAANTVTRTQSGAIIIGSSGRVRVSGRLNARGENGRKGGRVEIRSDGNIDIETGARISTSGIGEASGGGTVIIFAGDTATLASGALIDARGGDSGDGGFIEFSATKLVSMNGGTLDASAANGVSGAIYIDPTDVALNADTVLAAGNTLIEADNSITLAAGKTVSTADASDSITFRAPIITLQLGSKVTTRHETTDAGGNLVVSFADITLETLKPGATPEPADAGQIVLNGATLEGRDIILHATSNTRGGPSFGVKSASSGIELNGATILGRAVTLRADSSAESSFIGAFDPQGDENQTPEAYSESIGLVALGSGIGGSPLQAVVSLAEATSTININAGSRITATSDVIIDADASAKVNSPAYDLTSLLDPNNTTGIVPTISVLYSSTRPTAVAKIASGATIETSGSLNVTADTSNTLKSTNFTVTDSANSIDVGLTIAEASTKAEAIVEKGSTVTLNNHATTTNQRVNVAAKNEGDYEISTTVMALSKDGNTVGLTVTYADVKEKVTAELGANVTNADAVSVSAVSNIDDLHASASASTGHTLVSKILNSSGAQSVSTAVGGTILGKAGTALNGIRSAIGSANNFSLPLQLAGTASVLDADIDVEARITANTVTVTGANPAGDTTGLGDVTVRSDVIVHSLQNIADGEAQGNEKSTSATALALPVTEVNIKSHATIAAGSSVTTTGSVEVTAENTMPYEEQWTEIEGPGDILSKINGNFGVFDGFLNTGAFATSDNKVAGDEKKLGLAANVNLFTLNMDTLAQIGGDKASNGALPAKTTINADSVKVEATSEFKTANVSGQVGSVISPSGLGGSTGVGASIAVLSYNLDTISAIGANVDVTAAKTVEVLAYSEEWLLNIGASGKASTSDDSEVGAIGVFSFSYLDSTTHARIGAGSTVKTTTSGAGAKDGDIIVDAHDEAELFNIAGGIVSADNVGFGGSISVNSITIDTEAVVTDATEISAARDIHVDAEGTGYIHSYALAGTIASTSEQKPEDQATQASLSQQSGDVDGAVGRSMSGLSPSVANGGAGSAADNSGSGGANTDKSAGNSSSSIAQAISAATGPFGVSVAADAAVNLISNTTKAEIDAATVTARNLDIEAQSTLEAHSGAGAFSFQNFKDPADPKTLTAGLAGSYAHNAFNENHIIARLADVSHLTASGDITVNAFNGQIARSGAASGNGSTKPQSQPGTNVQIAGAVTFNTFANSSTKAEIVNVTIDNQTGVSANDVDDISVTARDNSNIQTGAGSLTYSGGSSGLGAGASASANLIDSDVVARIADSTINEAASVTTSAIADRHITSIAIGVGSQSSGSTGLSAGLALTYNSMGGEVLSEISGGSVTSIGAVNISSRQGSDIVTVAGDIAAGGKTGLGISIAATSLLDNATSRLSGTTVTAQSLDVAAVTDRTIVGIAAGASVNRDGLALKGSVVVNLAGNDDAGDGVEGTVAEIGGGADVRVSGALKVTAADRTNLQGYAGAFASATNGAGAAIVVNKTDGEVTARIGAATIKQAQSINVRAVEGSANPDNTSQRTQHISVAVSLNNSSNIAFSGAAAVNDLRTRTTAEVTSAATLGSATTRVGAINVRADDRTLIGSGALGGAKGEIGISAALAIDLLNKTTTARLAGSTHSSGNIVVDARSSTAAYGGLVSVVIGGQADVPVAAAIATQKNTTLAEIGDGATVHTLNNIHVNAEDKADIIRFTLAAGLASVQTQKSTTTARIGAASNVTALAGGSGLAVRTGDLTGGIQPSDDAASSGDVESTSDDLDGVNSAVGGQIASSVQGVNSQSTTSNTGAENVDATAILGTQTALTDTVSGVAVTANSDQRLINLGLGVQVNGEFGLGAAVTVSTVKGTTLAEIARDAQVNQGAGAADSDQDVILRARGNGLTVDTAVGIRAGGNVGLGAGVDVVNINRTTTARIGRGADVTATRDIKLDAYNKDKLVSVTAAVAAQSGGLGIGGSVGVTTLDNTAQAYVEDGTSSANAAHLSAGRNLTLKARNRSDAIHIVGALGVGKGGVGIGISVINSQNTARAYLGNHAVSDAQELTSINAESDANLKSITIALGGGKVGVAGALSYKSLKTTTDAHIGANARINQTPLAGGASPSATQDVTLSADDDSNILSVVGAAAGGLAVGLSAGADIIVLKGNSTATIGDGAHVGAGGTISLDAQLKKDFEGYTVTAGAGGAVGVSAAVTVLKAGGSLTTRQHAATSGSDGANSGSAGSEIASLTSGGNALANVDLGSGDAADEARSDTQASETAGNSSADILSTSTTTTGNDARAAIGANARVIAVGDVIVNSKNATEINSLTGGIGVGKFGGLGAGLAFIDVHTLSSAKIGAGAVVTGNNVTVKAQDGEDAGSGSVVTAFAGAGAVFIALGAAVADLDWTTTTKAEIEAGANVTARHDEDASDLDVKGGITVTAREENEVQLEAYGATVAGGLAGGAQIAKNTKKGTVEATIADGPSAASGAKLNGDRIEILASHAGNTRTEAIGANAAGLAAIGKIETDATDDIDVTTRIGDHTSITAIDTVTIKAITAPRVYGNTIAANAAAGAAIGFTSSSATAKMKAEVVTGTGVNFTVDGNLTLLAEARRPGTEQNAETQVTGGAGALLAGIQAVNSSATVTTDIDTTIGSNNVFTIGKADDGLTGTLTIGANSEVATDAEAKGGAGALLIAFGSINSFNTITNDVQTTIGAGSGGTVEGELSVVTTGKETLDAYSLGGAGGIVAGANARATNQLDSTVKTTFASNATEAGFTSGGLTVAARHLEGRVQAETDARAGGIIGMTGADASNIANATVMVDIGDKVALKSSRDMLIEASNFASKIESGDSVNAASGGVFDSSASKSVTNFHNDIDVIIRDAEIRAIEDGNKATINNIVIRAYSNTVANDTARIDSGGAIALAKAESHILVGTSGDRDHTKVAIDGGAEIWAETGNVDIGARTDSTINSEAYAKTYGLAGAAEGVSEARHFVDNSVVVGAGARIYAEESVAIRSGADDRGENSISTVARTRLWNKTVIPMDNDPKADAESNVTSTVDLQSGSRVNAVRNIELTATSGNTTADGFGRAQDLYQQALAAIGSFFSGLFGGGPVTIEDTYHGSHRTASATVNMTNAEVKAGFKHHQILEISRFPVLETVTTPDGDTVQFRNYVPVLDVNGDPIQSEGITYVVDNNVSLETKLREAIIAVSAELGAFGLDTLTKAALENELQILNARYDDLTAGAPLVDFGGGVLLPVLDSLEVDFITVNDVIARSGDVSIRANRVTGSGLVEAPGDTKIEIINNSPAFMALKDLVIPEERGGRIYFNGALVDSKAKFDQLNTGTTTPGLTLVSSANTTPSIEVTTTWGRNSGEDRAADLLSTGDVYNPNGSVTMTTEGNLDVSGNIRSATVNLNAGKDFTKSFSFGFFHVGGLPRKQFDAIAGPKENSVYVGQETLTENSSLAGFNFNTSSSIVAAENVFISAEKVNVNGLIQSGIADQTLVLDAGKQTAINELDEAYGFYLQNANANWNAKVPLTFYGLTFYVPRRSAAYYNYSLAGKQTAADAILRLIDTGGANTLFELVSPQNVFIAGNAASSDPNLKVNHVVRQIGATYNLETATIEVNKSVVGGGRVQIFGELLSTGGGQINVLDGFGHISITNQTSREIVLSEISTGGRLTTTETGDVVTGVEGRIRLIDPTVQVANPANPGDTTSRVVDYVRVGGVMKAFDNATVDASGNPTHEVANLGAGRTSSFTPTPSDARYGWTTSQESVTSTVTVYRTNKAQAFGGSLGSIGDALSRDPANIFRAPVETPLGDPLPVRVDPDGDGVFDGEAEYLRSTGTDYQFEFVRVETGDPVTTYENSDWCSKRVKFLGCFRRTYQTIKTVKQGSQLFYRHSVPANQAIGIGFIGYDQGSLNITSLGTINITENITSLSGTTSITSAAGNILQSKGTAKISAQTLNLTAGNGRIGGGAGVTALRTDMVGNASASVNIIAGRGVEIEETRGSLRYQNILAGTGDANITADLDILQATSSGKIQGRNINLTARSGGIGSASQAINIDTDNAAGTLNAKAAGNVNLSELNGDLRVVKIDSAGDVNVTVNNGNLLDANTNDVRDTATEQQLLDIWSAAALLDGADAEASRDASIEFMRKSGQDDYDFYWTNREANGGVYDAAFIFSFVAEKRQALLDGGYTTAAIARMESEKTELYHAMNGLVGAAPFDPNYDPSVTLVGRHKQNGEIVTASTPGAQFSYDTVAISEAATGYVWDKIDLETGISRGLISDRGNTDPVIEDPNIVARSLTLNVINGQIGTTKGTLHITRQPDGSPALFTDEIKLAIAVAERDDYTFGTDFVDIAQREDFDIAVTGNLDLFAKDHVFLGSEDSDINIVRATSQTRDIRIKTGGSITRATGAEPVQVTADNLILESSQGSIGSTAAPIVTSLTGRLTARASQGNVAVTDQTGNLDLDFVLAQGTAALRATSGAILDARVDADRNILAGNIILQANGNIGAAGNALEVKIDQAGGVVDITFATSSVWLDAPEGDLALGTVNAIGNVDINTLAGDLDTGSITTNGGVTLKTSNDMTLGNIASDAAITLEALQGSVTQADGNDVASRNGSIVLTARDDVTLGRIRTADTSSAGITIVSLAGAILDGGDTHEDIRALGVGSFVTLSAATGIGTGNALEVLVNKMQASNSTSGEVRIAGQSNLEITSLTQQAGAATVVTSTAGLTTSGAVTTAATLELGADGNLNIGSTVTATDIAASSGGNSVISGAMTSTATDIAINSGGDLTINAPLDAKRDLDLDSTGATLANLAGTLTARTGTLSVDADSYTQHSDASGQLSLTVNAENNVDVDDLTTSAAGTVAITSRNGSITLAANSNGRTGVKLDGKAGVTVTADLGSAAGPIDIDASAGAITLTGNATASGSVSADASGDVTVTGALTSTASAVDVTSGGAYVQTGNVSGKTGVATSSVGDTTVAGDIDSSNGGISVQSGNDLALTGNATARSLVQIEADRNAGLIGNLTSLAGGILAKAGALLGLSGDATGDQAVIVQSGSDTTMTGNLTSTSDDVQVTAGGAYSQDGNVSGKTGVATSSVGDTTVTGDITSTSGGILVRSGDNIALNGDARAQDRLTLAADNNITVTGELASTTEQTIATAGGDYSQTGDISGRTGVRLNSGGASQINSAITSHSGPANLTTGSSLDFTGSITAKTVRLTVGTDLAIADSRITSAGSIGFGVGGNAGIANSILRAGESINLAVGGDLDLTGEAIAGNSINLRSKGDSNITGTLRSGGSGRITVASGGELTLTGTATTRGGAANLSAGGTILADGAIATNGGNMALTAGVDVTLAPDTTLASGGGDITIIANGGGHEAGTIFQDYGLGSIDAVKGKITLKAATIILRNRVRAGSMAIISHSPNGSLEFADLTIADQIDLIGNSIVIGKLTQSGGNAPLIVNASAGGDKPARLVDITISSRLGVVFGVLSAVDATVRTDSELLRFQRAIIFGSGTFSNNSFETVINNRSPAILDTDVQLFQSTPGVPLYLQLFGPFFSTEVDTLKFNRELVTREMLPGQPIADISDAVFDFDGVLLTTSLEALDETVGGFVRIAGPSHTIDPLQAVFLNADPCTLAEHVNLGGLTSCTR